MPLREPPEEQRRRLAFKEPPGRRGRGAALNGAPRGRAWLCADSPRAPRPAPAPPTATPAAGERRPGGRRGLGREGRKVSGGRARRAPECRVGGGSARELAGGERPRAPRRQGRARGCALAGRCLAGRRRRAPSGRTAIPEQVPFHLALEALAAAVGPGGLARRGEESPTSGGAGVWDRLEPVARGKGPRAHLQASHRVAELARSLAFSPLPPPALLPASSQVISDFSAVLFGILLGQARLLEAGQPSRKENKLGTE